MKKQIIEAKKHLINLMCEEAKEIINNSKKTNCMCSVGWVDYLHGKNAIQHIFKGAYITSAGRVLMVESNDSEASVNIHLDQVTDVERIEWVLKGLKDNNERLD